MSSPTKRTLAHYRDRGFVAEVVERYNRFSNRRKDLFGFADIIAIHDSAIVAVQCTSQSHAANRIAKIRGECRDNARAWLNAGGLIHVVGWRRLVKTIVRKKDGVKRKVKRWEPRIETVTLEDLA